MIIVVYGKSDCSLCEKAIAALKYLQREFGFHIEYVDIAGDPAPSTRYRERIPVLVADGEEIAWGVVAIPALRSALSRLPRT